MSNIFHVPPDKAELFPSEKFVALIDAVAERLSQTRGMSTSMCSLMDMAIDEHRHMMAMLLIGVPDELVEKASGVAYLLHSLCHFVFEMGVQYQIELSNSLDDIDLDHLLD